MRYRKGPYYTVSRRRLFLVSCIAMLGITFLSMVSSTAWKLPPSLDRPEGSGGNWFLTTRPQAEVDEYDPQNYVRGPPTDRFRDNLLPNVKYVTSWTSAGWTNDVMTYTNLIYLGMITNRVPIVGMFTPSHIGGHVPPIRFNEVFDVPRFTKAMEYPLLEWYQVKNRSSGHYDELGCWSVWESVQIGSPGPRGSFSIGLHKLDISWTKAPTWIKSIPRYEHDQHSTFGALSTLAFPETRNENLVEPKESSLHHVKLPPDEQLLCYDYLYYVCSHQPFEFDFDFSPAWQFVGQHMHWTPTLSNLADSYLRRTFTIPDNAEIPPYISIHIRRGDFTVYCKDVIVPSCFAPLSAIVRRVEEVRQELLVRKNLVINHVVMTSDEKNATWWEGVTALGWFKIDHSRTVKLYGDWYPVLIDAVVQAGGIGFIGTDKSTMSVLARRRVQSWNDGVARTLKWGKPHADDH